MIPQRLVKATGPIPADLAFIGEAPGEQENKKGSAFCGKAGQLFDSLLWACGIVREKCYVDNVVPYWPGPGNPDPAADDVKRYGAILENTLKFKVRPMILVTLGRVSTRYFLGDVDMESCHSIGFKQGRWNIIPVYHPAAGLHNADLLQFTDYGLKQVAAALKIGPKFFRTLEDAYPKPDYAYWRPDETIIDQGTVWVDTEGVPGRPYCLTFSVKPGWARMIKATNKRGLRWFQEFIRGKQITFHNSMWDLQMMREMGIRIEADQIGDTIVKSFNLRVEPQGLKPLAKRHAGMAMQSYDDLTLPYDNAIMEEFLLRVVAQKEHPKPDPILEEVGGKKRVRQPQDLGRRAWSILSGSLKALLDEEVPNLRKRWDDIEPEVKGDWKAPDFTLDHVPEPETLYYACRDSDATCRIDTPISQRVLDLKVDGAYALDMAAIPLFERMQSNGMLASRERFAVFEEELTEELEKRRDEISRKYNEGQLLNPDSGDQVAALLFGKLGLSSERKTKSRARLATDDKALQAMLGQHPVVQAISDYRERSKIRQFVRHLPEYMGADNRVRGNIRVTRVVTGRPSMTEPNLLAIPVRTDLGKRVRSCFIAPPGKQLGTCDLNQIEMRVMAHLSRDERLVGLFNRDEDVHNDTASKMFGVPIAEVDPMRHRYPAKRVGFGVITGIQDKGLLDQMHLAGIYDYSLRDCAQMIEDWFKIYPGVKIFMRECRLEAKRNGFVRDAAGRIRLLPAVRSPFEWQEEEALRQSHSHKIQGTAAWLMKRAMKLLWDSSVESGWTVLEPLLQIYDEVIVEFKAGMGQSKAVGNYLIRVMTADSGQFCVPIKAKFVAGPDWGALEK